MQIQLDYELARSRRHCVGGPIKLSPVCQFEMTLAEDFSESVWGGTPEERRGADAARGAAGLGSATADDDGSGRMSQAPPRSITARSEADCCMCVAQNTAN
jgi:hypothetical protein